ncbi:MAG TPA: Stp1/IreP family PP2C-type Ser/Thr phosphatase [Phototrophicaceae bacterium]|nr:Stp1/IreP family PP2C-type Ser/Thr phosphatase [Phototrophicaceae bacterium]
MPPEITKVEKATDPLTMPPTTATLNVMFGDGATRPLPEDALIAFMGNGHLTFGQATDIGMVRTNNQDSAYSFFSTSRSVDERPDFGLFLVADGMGGHSDGEKASSLTARTVATTVISTIFMPVLIGNTENQPPISEALTAAIEKANAEVIKHVPDGGTTLTSAVIIGDLAYIAHVGDSRIYLINKDSIEQLTRDHSLVQRLIELDQLTPAEAADHPNKNMLYRALGQNEAVEIDTLTRRLPPKSKLLLCCDGLWNQVDDREMLDITKQTPNPQEACNKLIALANKRGGVDNVTVILLQMPG